MTVAALNEARPRRDEVIKRPSTRTAQPDVPIAGVIDARKTTKSWHGPVVGTVGRELGGVFGEVGVQVSAEDVRGFTDDGFRR